MYGTLCPRASEYAFLSSAHGTDTEVLMTTLSNKHRIKLEINNNKVSRKFPNIRKFSNAKH